jgi:4'-phosphopantetheinyl transferase
VTSDIVDIWLIWSDLPGPVLASMAAVLDDTERGRAGALIQAVHRRRFTAAHGAARLIIGHYLGMPPGEIRWRYGENGKPELAGTGTGAQLSLSHSGDLTALAVTRRRRVGVDVQQFPAGIDAARMAARFYPPAESRLVTASPPADQVSCFVRLWARKEACLKVAGGRLVQGVKLPVGGSGPIIVCDPGGVLPGPYLVQDVAVPRGFRAAIALEGTQPYRVRRHWWPPGLGRAPRA